MIRPWPSPLVDILAMADGSRASRSSSPTGRGSIQRLAVVSVRLIAWYWHLLAAVAYVSTGTYGANH
jgi:hypothetical protein